jgi:16S rRNA G966 N2-methylase RsmD
MYAFIKKTAESLGLENFKVVRSDVFRFMEQCTEKFDFIFAGPPYALKNIDDLPRLIFDKGLLKVDGWFILEHTPRNNYESFPHFRSSRNYGTTIFSIFVNEPAPTD